MNILFIGDVVGKSGRNVLSLYLSDLKKKYQADFTIVNGENSAHGKGITEKIYNEFLDLGVDCITMGNHTFSKSNIYTFIDKADKLVTPANRDIDKPGRHCRIFDVKGYKVGVCNLCGSVFMDSIEKDPIDSMFELIDKYPCDIRIIDFHGEATSEKAVFLRIFCKDACMIVGTHTHVQTADECIYNGCAFISDAGMSGAYDSVIGRDNEEVLDRVLCGKESHFIPSENPGMLCGVFVKINEETLRAEYIERIQIRP